MIQHPVLRARFDDQSRHVANAELLHQRLSAADTGAVRAEQICIGLRKPRGGVFEIERFQKTDQRCKGAQESNVEAIRIAMAGAPERLPQSLPVVISAAATQKAPFSPPEAPEFRSRTAVEHPQTRRKFLFYKES